jgi:drug/metabolite transporter (DMT)-like permease
MCREKNTPENTDAHPATPTGWLNPYLHIALNGLLVTTSELLLKYGAMETVQPETSLLLDILGFSTLGSLWVWGGITCYILAFVNWLHILRWIPLSIAFPLTSVVHVLIPLGSWLFLGEYISPVRWLGIAMIIAGIYFIAKPLMLSEEAL